MKKTAHILLIEDDSSIASSLDRVLTAENYTVALAAHGGEGLERAVREPYDVVITDIRLPGLNGLELVRQLHQTRPRLPIIVMTAHGTTETAIEATKFGAFEYLLKPFEMSELIDVVSEAVANSRLMSEIVEIGAAGASSDAIVGQSRAMQAIYKEIGRIAALPVTVLIRGETGTGKELIARAIYQHSARADAPFVAVNCAAIPETLLESEFFGHERGAFSGADARRIGRFEQANGGTLFLDEIGDLTPGTQAKLLRVLQEKHLQRLGGKENIAVDTRIIAATHRDLEAAIREKRFREDLFYRLSVMVVMLPPLRERREDIPDIVRYFLRKYGSEFGHAQPAIHPDAVQLLQNQSWPGNVRELENIVRKALLLARGFTIRPDHVNAALVATPSQAAGPEASLRELVAAHLAAAQRGEAIDVHGQLMLTAERELISQAIQLAAGNQAKAARWLGISRLTMREKLRQFGLRPSFDELGNPP